MIGLRERLRLFRSIRQLNRLHCFFASQDDVLDEFRSIETSRLKLSDSTTTINKAFTGREAGGRKVARSSYPETCAFVEFHLVSRSQGSIESLWALQGLASKFKFYSSFLLPYTSLYRSTENDSVFFTWRNFQSRSFSISISAPAGSASFRRHFYLSILVTRLPPSSTTTSRINPSPLCFFARSLNSRDLEVFPVNLRIIRRHIVVDVTMIVSFLHCRCRCQWEAGSVNVVIGQQRLHVRESTPKNRDPLLAFAISPFLLLLFFRLDFFQLPSLPLRSFHYLQSFKALSNPTLVTLLHSQGLVESLPRIPLFPSSSFRHPANSHDEPSRQHLGCTGAKHLLRET